MTMPTKCNPLSLPEHLNEFEHNHCLFCYHHTRLSYEAESAGSAPLGMQATSTAAFAKTPDSTTQEP